MSNTEIYIEKYKELESIVRDTYHLRITDSISYYLTQEPKYEKYKDKLSYCQKVRNFIQHEEKLDNEFSIIPSDSMIEFIESLIEEIHNEPLAYDICVKDVYFKTLQDSVLFTMRIMDKYDFSNVPIIENNKVIGVFNKTVLFKTILKDIKLENLVFNDIKEDCKLNKHYKFISKDLPWEDIKKVFTQEYENGNRVDLVLVTDTGDINESLIGIITPWIILGSE